MNDESHRDDLGTIARFLESLALSAEGHGRESLSPEDEAQLRRLAAGELSEDERSILIPLLAHNEVAMELLANLSE